MPEEKEISQEDFEQALAKPGANDLTLRLELTVFRGEESGAVQMLIGGLIKSPDGVSLPDRSIAVRLVAAFVGKSIPDLLDVLQEAGWVKNSPANDGVVSPLQPKERVLN